LEDVENYVIVIILNWTVTK